LNGLFGFGVLGEKERERERKRERERERMRDDGMREKGVEKHHTDEPFKLLTPETTRLSAF